MVEKTCGGCEHYLAAVIGGEKQVAGFCYKKPPESMLIGVQNGPVRPIPVIIPWRPEVAAADKACGDYLIPFSAIRVGDLALAEMDTEATKQ
jgi:hypothetical protein